MVLQKLSGRLSLQAFEALGRLPLADYRRGRLFKGDPAPVTSPKMVARWPTPGSRRQEDRLPRANHEARRLHKAGQDRTHQNYTHITVTRRGVATVRPTTPEARGRHGHRTPYGSAISRPARHCSHAGLNVIRDRRQYGPRVAGPFSQREARRRPGLPQSAKAALPQVAEQGGMRRRRPRGLPAGTTLGEAPVSSRRQDPRRWGRPVNQRPAAGGTYQ